MCQCGQCVLRTYEQGAIRSRIYPCFRTTNGCKLHWYYECSKNGDGLRSRDPGNYNYVCNYRKTRD
jgi:hypothetical protein